MDQYKNVTEIKSLSIKQYIWFFTLAEASAILQSFADFVPDPFTTRIPSKILIKDGSVLSSNQDLSSLCRTLYLLRHCCLRISIFIENTN